MSTFKYLSPDRTDVLKNQEIRFTQVKYLNDPFEFLPVISRIMDRSDAEHMYEKYLAKAMSEVESLNMVENLPEEYRSMIPAEMLQQFSTLTIKEGLAMMPSVHPKNLIPALLTIRGDEAGVNYSTKIRDSWQEKFGVLSLSQVSDNITMWSHYSRNHSGFVIEFNTQNPFFNCKCKPSDPIRALRGVKYETERPDIKLYDGASSEEEMITFLAEKILLTKSIDWAYEKELRMILPLNETTRVVETESQQIHLRHFEASAVTAIYLGVNTSENTRHEITNLLSEPRYRHAQLYLASLSQTHYKIDFSPLKA
jgi:hypothetical protein